MEYKYIKNNLLKIPEKYQMSTFENLDFLVSYKKSRQSILEIIRNNDEILDFKDVLNKTSILKNNNFKNIQKSFIETDKLLQFLYVDILNNQNNDNISLDILIKKFEIKKKIFESYDLEFKENTKKFINLKNYVLLSLICLLKFEKTNNLKFLNVSLKLNDTICSQVKTLVILEDILIFNFVIKKELQIIFDLCDKKGIINE
jgi:hypothetical protein